MRPYCHTNRRKIRVGLNFLYKDKLFHANNDLNKHAFSLQTQQVHTYLITPYSLATHASIFFMPALTMKCTYSMFILYLFSHHDVLDRSRYFLLQIMTCIFFTMIIFHKTTVTIFRDSSLHVSLDGFLVDTQTLWCCNVLPNLWKKICNDTIWQKPSTRNHIKKLKKNVYPG